MNKAFEISLDAKASEICCTRKLSFFFLITAKIYFKKNPSTRSAKGNPQEYIKKGAKAHRH
jgi:hypothetical protein